MPNKETCAVRSSFCSHAQTGQFNPAPAHLKIPQFSVCISVCHQHTHRLLCLCSVCVCVCVCVSVCVCVCVSLSLSPFSGWYGAHRHTLRRWAAPPPQSSYGALPPRGRQCTYGPTAHPSFNTQQASIVLHPHRTSYWGGAAETLV